MEPSIRGVRMMVNCMENVKNTKINLEYKFTVNYNFYNSRLIISTELIDSKQYQQPHTHNTL